MPSGWLHLPGDSPYEARQFMAYDGCRSSCRFLSAIILALLACSSAPDSKTTPVSLEVKADRLAQAAAPIRGNRQVAYGTLMLRYTAWNEWLMAAILVKDFDLGTSWATMFACAILPSPKRFTLPRRMD